MIPMQMGLLEGVGRVQSFILYSHVHPFVWQEMSLGPCISSETAANQKHGE